MAHLLRIYLKVLEHEAYCVMVQSSRLTGGLRPIRQRQVLAEVLLRWRELLMKSPRPAQPMQRSGVQMSALHHYPSWQPSRALPPRTGHLHGQRTHRPMDAPQIAIQSH